MSVGLSVGRSVTHSFDDPHVAPYWPTWPCFYGSKLAKAESHLDKVLEGKEIQAHSVEQVK